MILFARDYGGNTIRSILLFLTLLIASPAASAELPSSIRIEGGGYGHGHGMSQYGAEGAARQGLSYEDILAFYYPGTSIDSGQDRLRVWLSEDNDNRLTVPRQDGLTAKMGSTTVQLSPSPQAWRFRKHGSNLVLEKKTSEGWRRSVRLAGNERAEFWVRGKPVKVWKSGPQSYRGRVRAVPFADRLLTVNVVNSEEYLRGVVAREMPSYWQIEALKTQSVAARSYALRESTEDNTYYDLCDTSACQVYGGVEAETQRTDLAIRSTAREALRYENQWAFAQFSASNGGHMLAGSEPYLVSKPDPYDGWTGNSYHEWTETIDVQAVADRYDLGAFQSLAITRTDGPYALEVVLTGSERARTFSGWDFRNAAGLKSNLFQVR